MITRPRSLGKCTLRDRYPLRESGFQYVYGHEVHADACHKARSLSAPLPSLAPGPRQRQTKGLPEQRVLAFARIPDITLGIGFLRLRSGQALGHPSRQRLRVVPCSSFRWRATVRLLRSECPFFVTLGCVLCTGSPCGWIPYTA